MSERRESPSGAWVVARATNQGDEGVRWLQLSLYREPEPDDTRATPRPAPSGARRRPPA